MYRQLFILVAAVLLHSTAANAAPADPQQMVAVASIAEMTQLGNKYSYVHVAGYYPGSKRGGGNFSWDSSARTATDNCTVFSGPGPNGRWIRELTATPLDVTMCGAKWDGVSDDAAAINAAFSVASRNGLSVSCPAGTGKIVNTIAPASFAGVVFKCQGMTASIITCAVQNRPCFLFQNPVGSAEIQAPQFYDLTIQSGPAPSHPTAIIQYNSVAGGFADNKMTQSYMMRPIVQRARIEGGEIGIQCSKCFDGDMSLNWLGGQGRHGFDLEGSDWMSIGGAGTNRIVSTGDYPIKLASHSTFGNGNLVSHNDILAPSAGVKAYIYSSARSSYIEKNFLEGQTKGPCEILIDNGAMHAVVRDNHVTDPTVKNWLCVVPRLAQGEFSSNQTTSFGQGPARFDAGAGPYNTVMDQNLVHFGNWSENGFPNR